MSVRALALALTNRALAHVGLVVRRTVDEGARDRARAEALRQLRVQHARELLATAMHLANAEHAARRLVEHVRELDELLAGAGNSKVVVACRRVVDVALGRDERRVA